MINIIICDDDIDFCEIIEYKIKNHMKALEFDYKITKIHNLNDLKSLINENSADIVFIDIMVKDINSVNWTIENIKNKNVQLIFMTGFPTEAYNISETLHCYYLIKSKLTEEQLSKAIRRAIQNLAQKNDNLTVIKSGSKNYTINFQDILFIETFANNITIHLKNNQNITIYATLKSFLKKTPPCFLRCHKCYAINMNHVVSYEPHEISLFTGDKIPVPPKKYNSVIEAYKKYLSLA